MLNIHLLYHKLLLVYFCIISFKCLLLFTFQNGVSVNEWILIKQVTYYFEAVLIIGWTTHGRTFVFIMFKFLDLGRRRLNISGQVNISYQVLKPSVSMGFIYSEHEYFLVIGLRNNFSASFYGIEPWIEAY